jgi:type I restriction enzyme S subunit
LLGSTAIIPEGGKYIQSQDVAKIICKEDLLDKNFAFYLISSALVKQQLNAAAQQTKIRHTSPNRIKDCTIWIPELTEQKHIGKLLCSLDHKIELNRAINQNLEAMAKQLYDYWFVQFDFPNEEGKPYKSSGGAMVWNEKLKREIPQGWDIFPLFDAISVQYGFPFATEQFTDEITNIPIVRIRDILEGTTSAYSFENTDEKYCLNEGDVLVGMDGNFHMNFWHNNIAYLNQRCVRMRPYRDSSISSIQIYYNIQPYIKAKEQNAKGSTVGHLSDKDLKGLYLIKPAISLSFNPRKVFDELLALIIENKQQILSLTKQRGELLPLLMNGQVSVNSDLSVH